MGKAARGKPRGLSVCALPIIGGEPKGGATSARDNLNVLAGLTTKIDHTRAVLLVAVGVQVDFDENAHFRAAFRARLIGVSRV